MTAGYSGTPLSRKLGIKARFRVYVENAPDTFRAALEPLPEDVVFLDRLEDEMDMIHLFTDQESVLSACLKRYIKKLRPAGMLWVSWPKKASKVPTDITEDTIRDIALPLRLVDVKVCAIDDVWSGLKLVIRRENR